MNHHQEPHDLQELSLRFGLDLVHSMLKIKTIVADLMQENEMFNEVMIWLSNQVAN